MNLALFLLAEAIFNLGLSVFFLLFNLHLLDLGYDEAFLGLSAAFLTAGSVCGTLPAGWFTSRCGIGAALRITFAGGGLVGLLQALVAGRAPLLALAFLAGLAAAFRAVTLAPAVSALTTETTRARGFSWFFALGIGMGVLGGLAGGQLPRFVSKQQALWAGAGFALLALVPAAWLRFGAPGPRDPARVVYPRGPFVLRFLAAAAVWGLFMGAFPSLYNAYFARRLEAGTDRIGLIYAASQLVQVGAVLAAPRLFARIGLERGVAWSQAAAAASLALLAPRWPLAAAGAVYGAYMSFQYMNEPGWQTLLMNGVAPHERGGASALNFGVLFAAQAVSAAAFGWAVARAGYPLPLLCTAAVGLLAAAVFWGLLKPSTASQISLR